MATVFTFLTHEWLEWKMILNHYRAPSGLLIFKFFWSGRHYRGMICEIRPSSRFFVIYWTSFLSLSFTMFLLLHNDKLTEYCEAVSLHTRPPFKVKWIFFTTLLKIIFFLYNLLQRCYINFATVNAEMKHFYQVKISFS